MSRRRYVPMGGAMLFRLGRGETNPARPIPADDEEGYFVTVRDGTRLFVYTSIPKEWPRSTIYLISGVTGVNHHSEKELIERPNNNENRIVVLHPRGTGYSEGARGDIACFRDLIEDYGEVFRADAAGQDTQQKRILYGHSMSCAIALVVAERLRQVDGVILINPPYRQKSAPGMSPTLGEYLRYMGYYLFAPHVPIVDMGGDPTRIKDEDARKESEVRNQDPLLVKYISMYSMVEARKLMGAVADYARRANYPLLLIYGINDPLVDQVGCGEIFAAWRHPDKAYEIVPEASHGRSTALRGARLMTEWIARHSAM